MEARCAKSEAESRRDREELVHADRRTHLVAAERDMAAATIRDMQDNLVSRLEARVAELGQLLEKQTAALETTTAECNDLRGTLLDKDGQILELQVSV